MKLALFLLMGVSAFGQTMVLTPSAANTCSTTATSITCTQKFSANGFPFLYTVYAPSTLIAVTNSGGGTLTWSAAITGTLSSACGGPCMALYQQYTGTAFTSGTAPSTVKVNFTGLGSESLAIGAYTGTITFTPNVGMAQAITVTLNIVAASGEAETNRPNAGYPVGCNPTSTIGVPFKDKCTPQTPRMTPPSVCGTYTDPNFGATVKRVTPFGYAVEYSSSPFSASGTYIVTGDNSGFIHVFRLSDCMDMTGAVGGHGNLAFLQMSAINDQAWYYFTGATLHRYNFITTADTTLGNYAGGAYGFTTIYAGGTAQLSVDDWLSFYDQTGSPTKLCAVNIPQLITDGAPAGTNTYCRDYSADGITSLDWTGVWGVDSGNSKRYVWLSGQPWSGLYSVGAAGVLNLENTGPAWPGWKTNDDQYPCTASDSHCISSQSFTHDVLMRDPAGKAQLFGPFPEINGNQGYQEFSAAAATSKMFRMAEEPGGGMYLPYINNFDAQPGASDALGAVVIGPFLSSGYPFAAKITSATAANPPVLSVTNTLTSPHVVRVDGGTGSWTCLNGYTTAATTTGSTITLVGKDCTGAGSFAGQTVVVGDSESSMQTGENAILGQIVITIPGQTVKQIAMHRSITWPDVAGTGVSSYGATTKTGMSRDGSMVSWVSNFGTVDPNGVAVFVADTGSVRTTSRISGFVRISGRFRH